jgi:hypothetical protein
MEDVTRECCWNSRPENIGGCSREGGRVTGVGGGLGKIKGRTSGKADGPNRLGVSINPELKVMFTCYYCKGNTLMV